MQTSLKPKKNNQESKKSLKSYARYSSIAFQMAAIIFIGTFGGYKLDVYFGIESHVLTVILTIISVILAIYVVIKDLLKK